MDQNQDRCRDQRHSESDRRLHRGAEPDHDEDENRLPETEGNRQFCTSRLERRMGVGRERSGKIIERSREGQTERAD
jgi:hypothetical protein